MRFFAAGIERAVVRQFVSSFAASNEAVAEPCKARFLTCMRRQTGQKAAQEFLIINSIFDSIFIILIFYGSTVKWL